jgi:hypothetical protein
VVFVVGEAGAGTEAASSRAARLLHDSYPVSACGTEHAPS